MDPFDERSEGGSRSRPSKFPSVPQRNYDVIPRIRKEAIARSCARTWMRRLVLFPAVRRFLRVPSSLPNCTEAIRFGFPGDLPHVSTRSTSEGTHVHTSQRWRMEGRPRFWRTCVQLTVPSTRSPSLLVPHPVCSRGGRSGRPIRTPLGTDRS